MCRVAHYYLFMKDLRRNRLFELAKSCNHYMRKYFKITFLYCSVGGNGMLSWNVNETMKEAVVL
jgi:hypothetical protein